MSEDEIIKELKILIGLEEFNKLSYKENKAIKGLLDLYQKEKEKNKTLEELLQGKLFELYKYYKDLAGTYQANCISKDEIRKYIKENKRTYEMKTPNKNRVVYKDCVLLTKEAKELLEENNGK
jgi:hypothetical protein